MGSRVSINNGDDYINDANSISENELNLSNMDKLQIKAIQQITKAKELEEKKSAKIFYNLPTIHLCSISLFK